MFLKMDLSADILKEICRDFTSISSKLLSVSMGNIYYISFDKEQHSIRMYDVTDIFNLIWYPNQRLFLI